MEFGYEVVSGSGVGWAIEEEMWNGSGCVDGILIFMAVWAVIGLGFLNFV